MELVHALLDREVLLAGLLHDLRGALTAVHGLLELGLPDAEPLTTASLGRLEALGQGLSNLPLGSVSTRTVAGHRVRSSAPIELLEGAIERLPHGRLRWEVGDAEVECFLDEVPSSERSAGWSADQARAWIASGGPGFAGARLRVAARMVGVSRFSFQLADGKACGTVSFRLPLG